MQCWGGTQANTLPAELHLQPDKAFYFVVWCMYVCCVCVSSFVCACGNHRLILGVFFYHPSFNLLRQGLSLNVELPISTRLTSQWTLDGSASASLPDSSAGCWGFTWELRIWTQVFMLDLIFLKNGWVVRVLCSDYGCFVRQAFLKHLYLSLGRGALWKAEVFKFNKVSLFCTFSISKNLFHMFPFIVVTYILRVVCGMREEFIFLHVDIRLGKHLSLTGFFSHRMVLVFCWKPSDQDLKVYGLSIVFNWSLCLSWGQ